MSGANRRDCRHKLCPVSSRLRRRGAFYKGVICTARRRGVPFVRTKGTKIRLGLCPKTPLPLSCGWIRTMRSIVRTAPQIRSQGACGAFYFGFSRNRIKNQPYKRRLIPLRECAALPGGVNGAPQGRKTLWGEEDAPQRGGLPKVKHRVSPTQAEVASDERTGF